MLAKTWHKVLDNKNDLLENRVMTVQAGDKTICLTNYDGKISALDNKCPHQGGPLGEGSIENGMLRCPWHGWDFNPCTGQSPGGHDDGVATYEVKIEDNAVYVQSDSKSLHFKNVSDLMMETMVNWGVNTVFGMVGHSNLGVADAMRRLAEQGKLRYIGIRHEGAASFAASAYGKLTGKPAACFAIAGPGSTNMFTGLWDAKVDRAPILALTGQVDTQIVGTKNFQELDLVAAFASVAAFNHRVLSSSKHTELMNLAIKHAILQRDVAHLTFPDEVQVQQAPMEAKASDSFGRMPIMTITPPKESIDQAVELFAKSKRPVIIVGHGARFNMPAIIEFAEQIKAPILTTFKGKGQISDTHSLAGGVLGRSGTPIASWLMNESDLLCVFGASFSKHTGITNHKPTIQVDLDPLALSKFHRIDAPVWGEISVTVNAFKEALSKQVLNTEDQKDEVAERWTLWRNEKTKRLQERSEKGLSSIAVFDALNRFAPENAVMCVDVGNNAYSFGRYYECKSNNTFLMSGYLGSIGFALPASMGAWAAVGDTRPIVAVAGDGGFAQYMAEVTTLVKYQMPIKIILLNNGELGKISKEQRAGSFNVWQTTLTNPNFAEYSKSCGAWGKRVQTRETLLSAMEELFAVEGPALLEVMTDVALI